MRRASPEINAGSMADIAFLLLIFWLVATTLKPDRGIPNILEAADRQVKIAVPTKASDILRVHVDEDGNYLIDGVMYPLEGIETEILTLKRVSRYKAKLVVTADYEAPYKEYMMLLITAEEIQIKTIENEIHKQEQPETEGSSN